MGVEGTLEYLSDLLSSVKKKKNKPTQTVALKIRMDCEGCARKVKHVPPASKERTASTKKKVELWPYVPYNLVAHPYVAQAYDKKAPPNMVRSVPNTATISETTMDDRYTLLFSDDNPNACSIM
ncbi:hypothetical protein K1719_025268 [Acacia pycnantha]|nr:hypothetical protein K1719_025268 [Acacia pycnantha]